MSVPEEGGQAPKAGPTPLAGNTPSRKRLGAPPRRKGRKTHARAPAVRGWAVCRFHGARGGGPKGERNGMYRHGLYAAEAEAERKAVSELIRQSIATLST